ncbi:hypothetical protein GCM10027199_82860 [Amycolatopsis magusensis]
MGRTAPTQATWILPDGNRRTGLVPADKGLRAGVRIPIWIDRDGVPADPPLLPSAAATNSIAVGFDLTLSSRKRGLLR